MGLKRTDYTDPAPPPFGAPETRYPTPNIADLTVIETVPISPEKYRPIPYGTHHSTYADTGLILVWQGPVKAANNQVRVTRVYATENDTADNWYNHAIKFSGDVVNNPIFVRTSIVLRSDYTPTARGTAITTPNAGAPAGQAPAFNQPAGAVLVREETAKLDNDDPRLASLFIKVHRIYEVLPGPWLPFTRYDDDLGPIQGRRRAVLNTGQEASLSVGGKVTYEAREGSAIVSMEIEENWDDAEFPETVNDLWDEKRGDYQQAMKLVEKTGLETATFIATGGIATLIEYKGYNKFLLKQTIETWDVPGPILRAGERWDDNLGKITGVRRLVEESGQVQTKTASGQTRYEPSGFGNDAVWEVVESWNTSAFPLFYTKIEDERGPVERVSQLKVKTGSEEGDLDETGGTVSKLSYEPFSDNPYLLRESLETWEVPGPELTTQSIGTKSLIPERYRRLIRSVETNQPVSPDYTFPVGLTGDQRYIELAQQTVATARLKIIEEIINSGDALAGQDADEWGPLAIEESIVDEGDPRDSGYLVKTSRVTALGDGKAIKITVFYPSDLATRERRGQDYEQGVDATLPWTDTLEIKGDAIGEDGAVVKPVDDERDLVRRQDPDDIAVTAIFEAIFNETTGVVNLNHLLPDVLESIDSTMERSIGEGDYDETGSLTYSNSAASLGIRSSGQASSAIIPELGIQIRSPWAPRVKTREFTFYLPLPVTEADIRARIAAELSTTINAWPKFSPQQHSIKTRGERKSLQVSANVQYSASSTDTGSHEAQSEGDGSSREVSLTTKTYRLPPTIHGLITLTGTTTDNEDLIASASASISSLVSASRSETDSVQATVVPTSLAATPNATAIPSSGLYMPDHKTVPLRKWNRAKCWAQIVDMSDVG